MTHTTQITSIALFDEDRCIGVRLGEDRFFHAFLALKSQEILALNERKAEPSAMKARTTRSEAVREWSRAVAAGFICC